MDATMMPEDDEPVPAAEEKRPRVIDRWGFKEYDPDENRLVRHWHIPVYGDNMTRLPYDTLAVAAGAGVLVTGGAVIVYWRRHDWLRLAVSATLFGGCIYGLFAALRLRAG